MRMNSRLVIDFLRTYKDRFFSVEDIIRHTGVHETQISKVLRRMRLGRQVLYKDVGDRYNKRYIYTYREGSEDEKTCRIL